MFCSKCGKQIDDNQTACPYCNFLTVNSMEEIESEDESTENRSGSTLGTVSIVLGSLALPSAMLLAILGYVFGGAGLAVGIVGLCKNKGSVSSIVGVTLCASSLCVALINSALGVLVALG